MEDNAKESVDKPRPLNGPGEEKMNGIDEKRTFDVPVFVPNFIEYTPKRGRGRPLGSVGKVKKLLALASEGGEKAVTTMGKEFTPAVVIVEPGEDLVEKVWSLGKKNGPYVCIFTATGTISKVDLLDDISGDIITPEGILEILYVKGSNVSHLCMYVANEKGNVYNGTVCGQAIATGRIQVVAATFSGKGTKRKHKKAKLSESQREPQEQCQIETNSEDMTSK